MFRGSSAVVVAWLVAGCSTAPDSAVVLRPSTLRSTDPSARERLAACRVDPRVRAGRLSAAACAAGELFAVGSTDLFRSSPSARARPALARVLEPAERSTPLGFGLERAVAVGEGRSRSPGCPRLSPPFAAWSPDEAMPDVPGGGLDRSARVE